MLRFMTKLTLFLLLGALVGCGSDSGDSAKCDALKTDTTNCLDDYCANEGSGSTVCGCWAQGQDTNQVNCECVSMNWGPICDSVDLDLYQPGSLDCQAMKNALQGICSQ